MHLLIALPSVSKCSLLEKVRYAKGGKKKFLDYMIPILSHKLASAANLAC